MKRAIRKNPYDWTKERVSYLVENISSLKEDNCIVSPGQIWSIKKLLALDYYIEASHNIFKKNFDNWYFVDTHCGSGLIGFEDDLLKDEKFPGSPLIATLKNEFYPFSDYILSDISEDSIRVLKERLLKLKDYVGGRTYSPETRSFSETVQLVKDKDSKWGNMFLIFIDPAGFKDLQWCEIEKLLSIKKADIFINFMSYSVTLNHSHTSKYDKTARTFDSVFGTSKWRNCGNHDELVELYINQLRTKKNMLKRFQFLDLVRINYII